MTLQQFYMLAFVGMAGQFVLAFTLLMLFYRRLCLLFDSTFKDELWHYDLSNPFFPQVARAGMYALWVVHKKVWGANRPKVQAFDFRSQVDSRTFRQCWWYTMNLYVFVLLWPPMGIYLMIRDTLLNGS